jgi:tripartite-type tricarboxylate transporter receptor subunit TctC
MLTAPGDSTRLSSSGFCGNAGRRENFRFKTKRPSLASALIDMWVTFADRKHGQSIPRVLARTCLPYWILTEFPGNIRSRNLENFLVHLGALVEYNANGLVSWYLLNPNSNQEKGEDMKKDAGRKLQSTFSNRGIIACLVVGMLILVNTPGMARGGEKYPASPINIICPFVAGAATDHLARFMAEELSKKWGQPVNVINKPGDNTVIGTNAVMSSSPDGYTILADSIGSSSSQMGLKGLPYDPSKRSFLARAFFVPQVLIGSMNTPWQSLNEIAEAGRKNPAVIAWGTTAAGRGGSDLVQLQFFEAAGIDVPKTKRVDYDGSGSAIKALADGQIGLHSAAPAAVYPAVSSGKAKALAVTTPKRTPLIPNAPTTREAGFPGVDYIYWVGFSGPPGMTDEVKGMFAKTVEEILKDPEVVGRLAKKFDGLPAFLGLEAFRGFVQEEATKIERLQKLLTDKK